VDGFLGDPRSPAEPAPPDEKMIMKGVVSLVVAISSPPFDLLGGTGVTFSCQQAPDKETPASQRAARQRPVR